MDQADNELLERFVAAKDAQAFKELVRRHGPMVLGVCRRILANEHDADDGFQATFFVFARKAGSVRNRTIISHWLYRVAVRASQRVRKRLSRLQKIEQRIDISLMQDTKAKIAGDTAESLVDEEIDRLPRKFRDVLLVCCLDGKSYAEAATLLRCSESAIRNRLARARIDLRARLLRRGVALSSAHRAIPLLANSSQVAPSPSLITATSVAALKFAAGNATGPTLAAHAAKSVIGSMMLAKAQVIALIAIFIPIAAVPVVIHHEHAKHVHAPSDPNHPDPRYIGARARRGPILSYAAAERRLTISDNGEILTYTLPPNLMITEGDESTTPSDPAPGRKAIVVTRAGTVINVWVTDMPHN